MAILLRQWIPRETEVVEEAVVEAEVEDVVGEGVESLLSPHTLRRKFSLRRSLFLRLRWQR